MNVTTKLIKVRIKNYFFTLWSLDPYAFQPGFSSFGEKYFSVEIYMDFSLTD